MKDGRKEPSAKRAAVRKLLRARRWQEASDRDVAKEADVSRQLVGAVRRQMIAQGLHPARDEDRPLTDREGRVAAGYLRAYKPGASARGGYVYAKDGKTVKEVDWLAAEAEALSKGTGKAIRELLRKLRKGGATRAS